MSCFRSLLLLAVLASACSEPAKDAAPMVTTSEPAVTTPAPAAVKTPEPTPVAPAIEKTPMSPRQAFDGQMLRLAEVLGTVEDALRPVAGSPAARNEAQGAPEVRR